MIRHNFAAPLTLVGAIALSVSAFAAAQAPIADQAPPAAQAAANEAAPAQTQAPSDDPKDVRVALLKRLPPGSKLEDLRPSPIAGLYEFSQGTDISYITVDGKFFIDEIYGLVVVGPLEMLANILAALDHYLIDGIVNGIGALPRVLGAVFRPLQGGLVQSYALVMALGVLALVGALLWQTKSGRPERSARCTVVLNLCTPKPCCS